MNKEKNEKEDIKIIDSLLKNIELYFISGNYNMSNLENGKDDIIKTENLTITLTTSKNQNNSINNIKKTKDCNNNVIRLSHN